jgi:uncharacterized protein (TIGR00251 family)
MENWFRVTDDAILIEIKAFPGASKNEIAGIRDGRLCVRVAAAAQDGRANACLCEFLAKALGCAKRDVILTRGERSKLKTAAVPLSCEQRLREIDERKRI